MDKGQDNHARNELESTTETKQQGPRTKGNRKDGRLGQRTKRGNALLDALVHTARQEGIPLTQLAGILGVTYGYVAQLRTGFRKTERLSERFVQACAIYLKVPALTVKALAGIITARDFLSADELQASALAAGIRRLQQDVLLGGFFPASLWEADPELQAFVLLMFQEATGLSEFAYQRVPAFIETARAAAVLSAEPARKVGKR